MSSAQAAASPPFARTRAVLGRFAGNPTGTVRFALRSSWLLLAVALYVPLHVLWRSFGAPSPWSQRFLAVAARACGVRVSTAGASRLHDVFYVANHLSWIDICILGGATGTAFVSQDKIRDWPIIGWLARLNRTVFISRTDRMTVGSQVDELRAALAERQPVAIFPEGTTTDGRSLLPFKASLFAVLLPPPAGAERPNHHRKLVIQPVLLDFDEAGKSLAWIGEETAPENAWRVLSRPGTFDVMVRFLEPFDPGNHPHRKMITAEARRRIAAALSASLGGMPVD